MNFAQLLEDIKYEVMRLYEQHDKDELVYHNFEHTQFVVARAGEIALFYELNDSDYFTVIAAAWFHDTGYLTGTPKEHELRGAGIAGDFLREKGVEEKVISQVKGCIMATVMPQQPVTLIEKIVCDADLFHLGTEQFPEWNKKMRKEAGRWKGIKINKAGWMEGTLKLLQLHHYQTEYVQQLLTAGKQRNIEWTRAKEKEEGELPAAEKEVMKLPVEAAEGHQKKSKPDRPDRGIETMFRISSSNHQRLSDMADNKAHIMITTTSIILSVLLSVLLRKLEDNPNLILPTLLLLSVCVSTMVFCILATRPSLPSGIFSETDIKEKRVNLLFFGNFYRMSYNEYSNGMRAMMNDREFLYGSLIRDVYSQGIVLGRKYRLLRIGYNIFMFGIIASVVAFVIAVILYRR